MNPQPKVFLLIYCIALFSSIFVVVPLTMILSDFKSHCLLYATGNFTFDSTTKIVSFHLKQWGSTSDCTYILFVGFTHLFFSAALAFSFGCLLWKQHDRAPFGSFLTMIINGFVTFLTFIAALILSVGLQQFCNGLNTNNQNASCNSVDLSPLEPNYSLVSTKFFSRIGYLEFGIWFGLCTWLVVSMVSFFKVYYYHKNDDLLQSLAYEKETLLNRRRNYQQIQSSSSPPANA